MWHPDPKFFLRSKGVWGAAIAILSGGATAYFGREVDVAGLTGMTPDQLADTLSGLGSTLVTSGGAAALGGLLALAGRIMAKRPVTLTTKPDAPPPPSKVDDIERQISSTPGAVTNPSVVRIAAPILPLLAFVALLGCQNLQPVPEVALTPDDITLVKQLAAACDDWATALDGMTTALNANSIPAAKAVEAGKLYQETQPKCLGSTGRTTAATVLAVISNAAKLRSLTKPQAGAEQ